MIGVRCCMCFGYLEQALDIDQHGQWCEQQLAWEYLSQEQLDRVRSAQMTVQKMPMLITMILTFPDSPSSPSLLTPSLARSFPPSLHLHESQQVERHLQ